MKESIRSIIVAMDEKRGIGRGGDLLFRIREDFKRMTDLTTGHPLIMGSKTFLSVGRVLQDGRTSIVVTRDPQKVKGISFYNPEVKIASSISEAIELAKNCPGSDEIFFFGGGQIYDEVIKKDLVDKLYLTIVKGNYNADIIFPEYRSKFKIISEEERKSEKYKYRFLVLARQ